MSRPKDGDTRQSTAVLLSRVGDMVNKYFDFELRKLGSNRTRFNVLSNLMKHDNTMTPKFISKRILRGWRSVTVVIDNLERSGFVRREPDTKDRRSLSVILTEEGKKFIQDKAPTTVKICHEAMSCLEDDEVTQLNILLKKIRTHLLSDLLK
jgi:MarR family 2-MHQ and catechol resistance regulon transcriptional repressor